MSRSKSTTIEYLRLTRPFVGIPNETILSTELNELSVHSRWLYVVLITRFHRRKEKCKEYFRFCYVDLRKTTGYDDRRIAKCLRELEDAEFIEILHGGKNNPSQYRPVLRWLW